MQNMHLIQVARTILLASFNQSIVRARHLIYHFFPVFLLLVGFIISDNAIAQQNAQTNKPALGSVNTKVLIVYLSRTNNTKAIAELIQQQTNGQLIALETQTPYPKNYRTIVDQVKRENESGCLPKLRTQINNIAQYDLVFLGFPTWSMQMPPPMKSFLKQYDLSSKTVIPFNTNAGYGVGSGFDEVKQICNGCTVLPGLQIKGGVERDGILFVMEGKKAIEAKEQVNQWLTKLGQDNGLLNNALSPNQSQTKN